MFRNYLVSAIRSMMKHRMFSAINVLGLAIGLACCFLILLFVRDEMSFDRQWENAADIYRMETRISINGRAPFEITNTQGGLKDALLKDFPEIEAAIRVDQNQVPLTLGDRRFFESVISVDENFFQFFNFEFVEGSAETALRDVASMVITQSTARKFFGDSPALGQTLTADFESEILVTGVIKDLPDNTHFLFNAVRRINPTVYGDRLDRWNSLSFMTYIRLSPGASIEPIKTAMPQFVENNVVAWPTLTQKKSDLFQFRPLRLIDIHFQSWGDGNMRPLGNFTEVASFAGIALLILLIAAINFVNLSTARAGERAREVAMRKVLGARRKDLMVQFLSESVATALAALMLALVMVELAMPFYNQVIAKLIAVDFVGNPLLLGGALMLTLVVGLGAGVRPALVLSGFRPARILKSGRSSTDPGAARMRFLLVTVQFAISIALIVGTMVLVAQMQYAKSYDGGFKKDGMLILRNMDNPHVAPLVGPLMRALEAHPEINATTRAAAVPGDDEINITVIRHPSLSPEQPVFLSMVPTDYDFLKVYGVEPLAGRLFDPARRSEALLDEGAEEASLTPSVVVNEATVRLLGYPTPADAIGQTFQSGSDTITTLTIIGVVPDVQMYSVHTKIEPTGFVVQFANLRAITVSFETADLERFLADVDAIWNDVVPAAPIQRQLLSDSINALYADEETQSLLLAAFAVLAVIVSSLGLLGLAAFTADRSTKEIGIRKVFGASVPRIIGQMTWNFSKPVLVANIIAWPAAWYFLSGWLEGFAYRIDLSPAYFALAGGGALVIAWVTVAAHAARVARTNPITALRYE
ncbi:MAG: ABC transporter permease [Sphingomonadales bacterium]